MPNEVVVKTKVSTRTKVAIGVVAGFALVLAAYGFGLLPLLPQKAQPPIKPQIGIVGTAPSGGTPTTVGTLNIASDNQRSATILVAGGDDWQNVAQYRAVAGAEDVTIDRLAVHLAAGVSDGVSQVGVWKDGALVAYNIFPGGSQYADIDLTSQPIRVPAGGSVVFQLVVKLAGIPSSSSVGSVGMVNARRQIAVELAHDVVTGAWSSSYAGRYDVHSQGSRSGAVVYSAYTPSSAVVFVVRASKPVITPMPLMSTFLYGDRDQELYKFQMTPSDPSRGIAWKKISFQLKMTHTPDSSFTLSAFRFYRGSIPIPPSDVQIIKLGGLDLSSPTSTFSGVMLTVAVIMRNQEVVTGSGNVYVLHATIGPWVRTGDSVQTSLLRVLSNGSETGYLTSADAGSLSGTLPGPHLDTTSPPDNTTDYDAAFLWSDLSEVPHSDQPGRSGGSYDWALNGKVDDMNQLQTLTR